MPTMQDPVLGQAKNEARFWAKVNKKDFGITNRGQGISPIPYAPCQTTQAMSAPLVAAKCGSGRVLWELIAWCTDARGARRCCRSGRPSDHALSALLAPR